MDDKPVPKTGPDGETGVDHRRPETPSYPSRRTAGSYVQRQTKSPEGAADNRPGRQPRRENIEMITISLKTKKLHNKTKKLATKEESAASAV